MEKKMETTLGLGFWGLGMIVKATRPSQSIICSPHDEALHLLQEAFPLCILAPYLGYVCVCMYIYICIYIICNIYNIRYIYTYLHISTHIYIYLHISTYIYIYIYILGGGGRLICILNC